VHHKVQSSPWSDSLLQRYCATVAKNFLSLFRVASALEKYRRLAFLAGFFNRFPRIGVLSYLRPFASTF
jgi:hypothetical protein